MDPVKEIITQGAMQIGTMNTQLMGGMATMATQLAANMSMAANSFAAAAPDLSTLAPTGMQMFPQMPAMGGVPPMVGVPAAAAAAAPVATPAQMTTTRYGARLIV